MSEDCKIFCFFGWQKIVRLRIPLIHTLIGNVLVVLRCTLRSWSKVPGLPYKVITRASWRDRTWTGLWRIPERSPLFPSAFHLSNRLDPNRPSGPVKIINGRGFFFLKKNNNYFHIFKSNFKNNCNMLFSYVFYR